MSTRVKRLAQHRLSSLDKAMSDHSLCQVDIFSLYLSSRTLKASSLLPPKFEDIDANIYICLSH
ncbi:hypothetical protein NC653_004642 [Populus alba x Populus x berolinensis]|uniref:Uncharacterized protein n=1 Tax=Populus alba x Populus x berolinensis TaxID=444605 RepID=A0AAD6RVP0_9ROSI|nr:hypothetical protein NC653_004642 [Populus alba x Populus x berolinensis]